MDPAGRDHLHRHRHLTQGAHEIVLEYFEAGGDAVAKLGYEPTAEPPPAAARAVRRRVLRQQRRSPGAPVLTRTDDAIDFDWGEGSPGPAVPADRFSARWTRTKTYEAGTYGSA